MKTKSIVLAMALMMIACQPNTDKVTEANAEIALDYAPSSSPAMNEALEIVHFSPPKIQEEDYSEPLVPQTGNLNPKTKKIIKDGSISIRVEKIEASKERVDSIVKSMSAYYETEEYENYETKTQHVLKIRIPSNRFEEFIGVTEKGSGELTSKTINARDVTEEYTDTEIRLESKKLFRKRYNELLSKAGKVTDILAIEENIRALQEEIESKEGRLKYINDQVAYSTLELSLFKLKEIKYPDEKKSFGELVTWNLEKGWMSVIDFMLLVINKWPWLILVLVAFIVLKSAGKLRKIRTKQLKS